VPPTFVCLSGMKSNLRSSSKPYTFRKVYWSNQCIQLWIIVARASSVQITS